MMVTAPLPETSTTASIMDLVPFSNLLISNTPAGPFQTMVLARAMACLKISLEAGPQSRPIQPSGMPLSLVAAPTLASSANLSAVTKSTGRWTLTPLALAFSIMRATMLAPSLSNKEPPICMPSSCLRKVKAIPPPMIISSTLSRRFSIRRILSDTLAPPRMARKGRSGFSRARRKESNSFFIKKPAARLGSSTPTMELWALWAVPKASFT
eukprot:Colp12_sorted_trinity150504_noHs@34883